MKEFLIFFSELALLCGVTFLWFVFMCWIDSKIQKH